MTQDRSILTTASPASRRRLLWLIAKATVQRTLDSQVTDLAAALAYYSFLALPALLLTIVGLFSLIASPFTINSLIGHLGHLVPHPTASLVGSSLRRLNDKQRTGYLMTVFGALLALWSSTGAVAALMRALNRTENVRESRSFLHQRFVALQIVALLVLAFGLLFGGLVLGPPLSSWFGRLVHEPAAVKLVWYVAEWPLLVAVLFAVLVGVFRLAPSKRVEIPHVIPGSVVAMTIWLITSGVFALYVSAFSTYNKTWGSLAAVIIMLTWLWLSAIALLVGAELNVELSTRREMQKLNAKSL